MLSIYHLKKAQTADKKWNIVTQYQGDLGNNFL
jgi:hypothetical protein